MILKRLTEYYEHELEEEPDKTPRYGWSVAKVSFALQIDYNGNLLQVIPLFQEVQRGKKTVEIPSNITVPEQAKRSSGICPQFLCDNAAYLLGIPNRKRTEKLSDVSDKERKNAIRRFEASQVYHMGFLEKIDTPEARAVYAFFEKWDPTPEVIIRHPAVRDVFDSLCGSGNLVFRLDGQFVHDSPAIRDAWKKTKEDKTDVKKGICLVTGQEAPIAQLHPSIKGVMGAQSSGGSLISYNTASVESYGKNGDQGYNAYVSEYAAFAYTTALNMLLADRRHVQTLGDTTIVYWAEKQSNAYQDFFSTIFDTGNNVMDDKTLGDFFDHVKRGAPIDVNGFSIDYDNPFYILGLSPNAARISVRFFLTGTFGFFLRNAAEHFERLKIVTPSFVTSDRITIWQMMMETVNPNDKDKKSLPILAGAVLRSILTGREYPVSLYQNLLLRIHAETGEKKITYRRAAIIRAYMIKNKGRKITVALDPSSKNVPYVLGRLFAELEKIQLDSNREIQATIKDRYFNSACATPARVFPVLQKLSQHHLRKLEKGKKTYHESKLSKLMNLLDINNNPLPKGLSLEEQGIFVLGYYHQRQDFFKTVKKEQGGKEDE